MVSGGKPKGVYVVTDADLEGAVGGTFVVQPGPAIPTTGFAQDDRGVSGGKPFAVYVVDEAEVNRRGIMGGKPVPIVDLTSSDRGVDGPFIAVPVYILSGADNIGDGGGAPAPPVSPYTEHNAFAPLIVSAQADTNDEWTLLTGAVAGIQQTNNAWYPAKVSGYTGVRWSGLPIILTTDDNYMQVEAFGAWTDSGKYIGPALRMSATQNSFYAFLVSGDDQYIIRRVFEGALTNEKTGALGLVIAAGDIIRIEVEGDVVSGYINGALIDSYTDINVSKNTTGWPGVVADGLGSTNRIVNFHASDLNAEGNLSVFGMYAANPQDDRYYTDSCFDDPDDLMDGTLNSAALHFSGDLPHFIELDFLEFRIPSRIRSHGTTSTYMDWEDVDVMTKVEIGDDWTEVATGLDLDNDGVDGWKESGEFSILQPCRYVRVEINATGWGGDFIGSEEVEFRCVGFP